jgi:hypothetical protein
MNKEEKHLLPQTLLKIRIVETLSEKKFSCHIKSLLKTGHIHWCTDSTRKKVNAKAVIRKVDIDLATGFFFFTTLLWKQKSEVTQMSNDNNECLSPLVVLGFELRLQIRSHIYGPATLDWNSIYVPCLAGIIGKYHHTQLLLIGMESGELLCY